MIISKSFKIYIHIFAIFFLAQQLFSETNYSKNIVVHKEPLDIKELEFKDFNLNDVDLTSKKYSNKLMQLRVKLQFIAIIVLVLLAYFFKN